MGARLFDEGGKTIGIHFREVGHSERQIGKEVVPHRVGILLPNKLVIGSRLEDAIAVVGIEANEDTWDAGLTALG